MQNAITEQNFCLLFVYFVIVDVTAVYNCNTAFVCTLITEEVSTLFRGTSLTTTLMDQYMKMVAIPYLQKTIGDVVAKILECKQSCEVCVMITCNCYFPFYSDGTVKDLTN